MEAKKRYEEWLENPYFDEKTKVRWAYGDTACDHYHRYREDVQIMKEIGLKAYRFSIDWSRVLPEGTGRVNEEGIRFYSNLIVALLENDIEPYIMLYHWELPYELYKKGGWMNRDIAEWFGEYARLVAERCPRMNRTGRGMWPGGQIRSFWGIIQKKD